MIIQYVPLKTSRFPALLLLTGAGLLFGGRLALAQIPAEPVLTCTYPASWLLADHPYQITCSVAWQGDAAAYTVLPLQFTPPAGCEMRLAKSEAWRDKELYVVSQTLELTPRTAGRLLLDPIKAPVVQPDTPMMQRLRTEGRIQDAEARLILQSEELRFRVWMPWQRTAMLLTPALLLALAAGAGGLAYRKHAKRRDAQADAAQPATEIEALLHQARRRRLDKAHYEYYQILKKILLAIQAQAETLQAIEEKLQAVGFQGYLPDDATMDADLAQVEAYWRAKNEPSPLSTNEDPAP